jgi:hypothetical protein
VRDRGDVGTKEKVRFTSAILPKWARREAEKIGPATIALFEAIMEAKPHPEQGFRSCLGRRCYGFGCNSRQIAPERHRWGPSRLPRHR